MMAALPWQAVIFDLDGTLIDSSPSILQCFGQALDDAGLKPLVPLADSLIGPPLRQTLIKLTGSTDDSLLDRLVDGFKSCYDTGGYKATRMYDGVEDMLRQLSSRGIPLAIATNKRRVPTMKIIDHLGWQGYFRIVGTLDTPTPPYADKATLISYLLNEMQLDAENTLYVGDKQEDGEAARRNGISFAAASWGYGEWDEIAMCPDWHIISSPTVFIKSSYQINWRKSCLTSS